MSIWQIIGFIGALVFVVTTLIYVLSGCRAKWAEFVACASLIIATICVVIINWSDYRILFGIQ